MEKNKTEYEGPEWTGKGWQEGGWLVTVAIPNTSPALVSPEADKKDNHLPPALAARGGHINIIFSGH